MSADELIRIGFATVKNHPVLLKKLTLLRRKATPPREFRTLVKEITFYPGYEATEGLAPIIRQQIWECLAMLKAAGQSILVIDKNIAALARLADHHCILEKGRVVWQGDSDSLRADPQLTTRYLGV